MFKKHFAPSHLWKSEICWFKGAIFSDIVLIGNNMKIILKQVLNNDRSLILFSWALCFAAMSITISNFDKINYPFDTYSTALLTYHES